MRVLVLAPGTRGDVAPAAGLGAAFAADGHEVTIVAGREYGPLVTAAGCAIAPVDAPVVPAPDAGPQGVRGYLATLRTYMDAAASVSLAAAPGAEAVVANAISPYGHDIAEGLGVPSVDALLQPAHPSAAYPPMIATSRDLGRFGNRLAGRLASRVGTPYDAACERIRAEFGLPARTRRAGQAARRAAGRPVHHGISAAVLPRPADWPGELSLDGFWWPPETGDWTPSPGLAAFLDDGPPPVVVTLGSMPAGSATVKALFDALAATGGRALLQGAQMREVAERLDSPKVLHIGDVPHSRLFPRAAAVVHHAGAGVAASALRAGVPSVTLPVHTDQPFWARRIAAIGAGTPPIASRRVDGDRLAAAISTARSSAELRAAARAVAAVLACEDGTAPLREWLKRAEG